jgi:hypothetical protein
VITGVSIIVGSADGSEAKLVKAASAAELPTSVTFDSGEVRELHLEGRSEAGGLQTCLVCGHPELHTAKDFPRALGIGIVVVAAVLAPFTYYISLGVAALLDLAIYHMAPEVVTCYVCNSEHRAFPDTPRHPRFDLQIADRLQYGERAVMGKAMRPGGTADGPEPEH